VPKADGFVTDSHAALSEQFFYISVTESEAIVEPDCLADDISRESL
jgi:hypothetical protein